MMQNSRISHRPENGRKAGYPPMQKSDAFGRRIRWQVSRSAAPKAASPLSCPTRTFPKFDPDRAKTHRRPRYRRDARNITSPDMAATQDSQSPGNRHAAILVRYIRGWSFRTVWIVFEKGFVPQPAGFDTCEGGGSANLDNLFGMILFNIRCAESVWVSLIIHGQRTTVIDP